MPQHPQVTCPECGRVQADGGRRNSCVKCGFQPVPSYAYPSTSVFFPQREPADSGETIEDLFAEVKHRRGARATALR